HMIMCQYLYAEFSLKSGSADDLTAGQAETIRRWRKTLREIAVEEMLHLALVSNLMTAIGAAPVFGRPNFPQRSGYFPAAVRLDLLPCGARALRHFLFLERPEGIDLQDAQGFVSVAPAREPVQRAEALPRGQEFATIGHLYRGIAEGLRGLTASCGERAVFVGPPRAQATPERLGWPPLIPRTRRASAPRGGGGGGIPRNKEGGARVGGAPRPRAGPGPCGGATTPCGSGPPRSSPPAPSCPATPANRSASPPRSRSSPTRSPLRWPGSPRSPTNWCCSC